MRMWCKEKGSTHREGHVGNMICVHACHERRKGWVGCQDGPWVSYILVSSRSSLVSKR